MDLHCDDNRLMIHIAHQKEDITKGDSVNAIALMNF